jgi:hypothetical protein
VLKLHRQEQEAREAVASEEEGPADGKARAGGKGRMRMKATGGRRRGDYPPATEEEEVRSALAALPAHWCDDYGFDGSDCAWCGVCMALHDWDQSRGLALAHEWSSGSAKYDAEVLDAKWKTFTAGGGLTVASIFRAAIDNGWQPPRRDRGRHGDGQAEDKHEGNGETRGQATAAGEDIDAIEIVDRWPELDDAAFHGIAGEIANLIDPITEADRTATLLQLLVGLSNLIGRGPYFQVNATRHYLNLFHVLVGVSAHGRKGTSWDNVRYLAAHIDPDWEQKHIQSGLVSGEGLIYHIRDPIWKPVQARGNRLLTPLSDKRLVDPGVTDKRLMIVEPEFPSVLKVMSREGNILPDVIKRAWDGNNLGSLAKNSPNTATAPMVSIIGHSTVDDIKSYLTETDAVNGFGNRFLWPLVRASKDLPEPGRIETVDCNALVRRLHDIVAAAKRVKLMERDDRAKRAWREMYPELNTPREGLLGSILSRGPAQVMRHACGYALFDLSATVRVEHLAAARAIWTHNEASAALIFGASTGDRDGDKVLKALRDAPDGLTRTAITMAVFQGHKKATAVAALLERLFTAGLIHRRYPRSTGGRPAEIWHHGRMPREEGTNGPPDAASATP